MAPTPLTGSDPAATWLNAGAAEAQPCGTDNTPSEAARPTPAVTALLIPAEPNAPVPEPTPLPSSDPHVGLPKTLATGLTDRISPLAEPSTDRPEVDIDADDPVADTMLVPDVSAADELTPDNDDSGEDEVAEAVDATPGTALGTAAAELNGVTAELKGVDTADVNGDTVCALVPAGVPAACATAASWLDNPAGLVACCGVVNGVSVDAACDAPE